MQNFRLSKVLPHLHGAALLERATERTDGQLLEAFVSRHEEVALEALVRRHAVMVWGVCRRVLRTHHDAEDAFQATFLVLFRRAAALERSGSVANWLFTVAYHVALRAKAQASRRQRLEREIGDVFHASPSADAILDDLQPVLDEELNRLPDKYRAPVVLCYLEGKTTAAAAWLREALLRPLRRECPGQNPQGRPASADNALWWFVRGVAWIALHVSEIASGRVTEMDGEWNDFSSPRKAGHGGGRER